MMADQAPSDSLVIDEKPSQKILNINVGVLGHVDSGKTTLGLLDLFKFPLINLNNQINQQKLSVHIHQQLHLIRIHKVKNVELRWIWDSQHFINQLLNNSLQFVMLFNIL